MLSNEGVIGIIGLVMFVVIVAIDVVGLTLDLVLVLNDLTPISFYAARYWSVWLTVVIPQIFLVLGIVTHFRYYSQS